MLAIGTASDWTADELAFAAHWQAPLPQPVVVDIGAFMENPGSA
jgi:hypothetical protein